MTTRLLAGARPTGGLHIGHYLGTIKPFLRQLDVVDEAFFVLADLHMFTTNANRAATDLVPGRVERLVRECVAAGLDPRRCGFYLQSGVVEQGQLYAIVQSLVPYAGLLEQPSFAAMSRSAGPAASLGLLGYPVLECADVIGMAATSVAVGEHNVHHVTVCQDIVDRLDTEWGLRLARPEPATAGANLIGLDGREKMSKSLGNAIDLAASEEDVEAAVGRMVIWGADDRCVPAEYVAALADEQQGARLAAGLRSGQVSEADARTAVHAAVEQVLGPVRERLRAPADSVADLLAAGEKQARELTADTLGRVRRALSFRPL